MLSERDGCLRVSVLIGKSLRLHTTGKVVALGRVDGDKCSDVECDDRLAIVEIVTLLLPLVVWLGPAVTEEEPECNGVGDVLCEAVLESTTEIDSTVRECSTDGEAVGVTHLKDDGTTAAGGKQKSPVPPLTQGQPLSHD